MCSKAKAWKDKDRKHIELPKCDAEHCKGYRGNRLIRVPLGKNGNAFLCKACHEKAVV